MAEVKDWKFVVDNVPNIHLIVELVESDGLKPMDAVPVVSYRAFHGIFTSNSISGRWNCDPLNCGHRPGPLCAQEDPHLSAGTGQ